MKRLIIAILAIMMMIPAVAAIKTDTIRIDPTEINESDSVDLYCNASHNSSSIGGFYYDIEKNGADFVVGNNSATDFTDYAELHTQSYGNAGSPVVLAHSTDGFGYIYQTYSDGRNFLFRYDYNTNTSQRYATSADSVTNASLGWNTINEHPTLGHIVVTRSRGGADPGLRYERYSNIGYNTEHAAVCKFGNVYKTSSMFMSNGSFLIAAVELNTGPIAEVCSDTAVSCFGINLSTDYSDESYAPFPFELANGSFIFIYGDSFTDCNDDFTNCDEDIEFVTQKYQFWDMIVKDDGDYTLLATNGTSTTKKYECNSDLTTCTSSDLEWDTGIERLDMLKMQDGRVAIQYKHRFRICNQTIEQCELYSTWNLDYDQQSYAENTGSLSQYPDGNLTFVIDYYSGDYGDYLQAPIITNAFGISADTEHLLYTLQSNETFEGDSWEFQCRAFDADGNLGEWISTGENPIGSAPIVTISSPGESIRDNEPNLNITYNVTSEDPTQVLFNCTVWIDGSPSESSLAVAEGVSDTIEETFSEGTSSYYINCTDGTKNGYSVTYQYELDTNTPLIISTTPSVFNTTEIEGTSFDIEGNVTDAGGLYTVNISILRPDNTTLYSNSTEFSEPGPTAFIYDETIDITGEPDGTYQMTILGVDEGSLNPVTTYLNFLIDNCQTHWVCSLLGTCSGGTAGCAAVTDLEGCNESYTGNYSEFPALECSTVAESDPRGGRSLLDTYFGSGSAASTEEEEEVVVPVESDGEGTPFSVIPFDLPEMPKIVQDVIDYINDLEWSEDSL
jgi:hypothetical protein